MNQQRGMALLSVLLILTLVLLLVGGLMRQQRVAVAATGMHLDTLRLRQALLEGEARLLKQLPQWERARAGPVHLDAPWAQSRAWTLEDGTRLQGKVVDLAGRFNLAWLARPTGSEQFRRLLKTLDLTEVALPETPLPVWRDLSQARLLPGVTRPWLARLDPHVAWMPTAARVNVNTAEAPLLASLGIPFDIAVRLAGERPPGGFATVQAWRDQPGLQGIPLQAGDLAVSSRWFRLELTAQHQQRGLSLRSDVELATANGRPQVLRHWVRAIHEEAFTP